MNVFYVSVLLILEKRNQTHRYKAGILVALNRIKQSQDPEIPNIFDILKKSGNKTVGYKIVWEINDIVNYTGNGVANGTSYSLTEYYDIENRRGRLDIAPSHDVNGTFIYDAINNETFYLTMGKCIRGNIAQKPDFLKKFMDDYWTQNFTINDRTILGPSSLFRLLYLLSNRSDLVRFVQKLGGTDKRYFNGNLWNSIPATMGWVFTEPSSPNPYGFQNIAFPVWVGVGNMTSNGWVASKIYEVAQFTPYTIHNKKTISVPLGLGCGRNPNAITKAPVAPSIRKEVSYDMKLEVIMQPGWVRIGNDYNPSNLIDNGRLTYDDVSNMTAWEYTGFNNVKGFVNYTATNNAQHSEAVHDYKNGGYYYDEVIIDTRHNSSYDGSFQGLTALGLPSKIVWDHGSGIMYMIDDISGGCAISQKKENDFTVSINFKSGVRIPVNTPYLLQNDGFVYMGEFLERGIPTIVFERRVDNMKIGFGNNTMISPSVVFTHYYMKNNYSGNVLLNDMLIKIGISILSPFQNGTIVWSATINVNEFTVKIDIIEIWPLIKQKVFNIKSCYLTQGQSKWFQIGIPITPRQYLKLFQQSDAIIRNFLNYMYTAPDMRIHPTRIPVTLTGWDDNTLYISALLLERPPFSYDFYPISINQRIRDIGEQSLVNNYQQCAGPCLDEGQYCNYFSLCDDFMCILGGSQYDQPALVAATNCTTYKKTTANPKRTLNNLINLIQNKVLHPIDRQEQPVLSFTFNVYVANASGLLETIPLTGVQFKSGFNFGYYGRMDRNDLNPAANERYDMKPLTHYVIVNNDKRLSLVPANGYRQCQEKCENDGNNTCHSFSFCTKDNECILSTMYFEQLNATANTQTYVQRSDCAILYRQYLRDYTRYGELQSLTTPKFASKQLLVKNSEECAIKCYNETSFKCRSFDNCATYGQTPLQYNCFLHSTHYLDTVQPITETLQLKFDNSTNCGHYSRNYASDYNVRNSIKYADNTNKLRITVTGVSVEQCARDCSESQSLRQCLGFTFCSSNDPKKAFQTSCVLSPTNDQNNLILYTGDPQCSIYFRDQISFALKLANDPKQSEPTLYSSGAGAGIGIVMILLGAALVVLIIIVYNKRKAALTVA